MKGDAVVRRTRISWVMIGHMEKAEVFVSSDNEGKVAGNI